MQQQRTITKGSTRFRLHASIPSFTQNPEHAILALPAAKVYAEIAPAAPHALHMPSHIFVQLGMWEGVVASNDASYKAALDHVERKGLKRGRSEFHSLQWYHYGQLQLGNTAVRPRIWMLTSQYSSGSQWNA